VARLTADAARRLSAIVATYIIEYYTINATAYTMQLESRNDQIDIYLLFKDKKVRDHGLVSLVYLHETAA